MGSVAQLREDCVVTHVLPISFALELLDCGPPRVLSCSEAAPVTRSASLLSRFDSSSSADIRYTTLFLLSVNWKLSRVDRPPFESTYILDEYLGIRNAYVTRKSAMRHRRYSGIVWSLQARVLDRQTQAAHPRAVKGRRFSHPRESSKA